MIIFFYKLRRGYVFLITVLFVGIVGLSIMSTYFILSTAALQNGWSLEQSAQALGYAETCAEHALRELTENSNYGGQDTFNFMDDITGTCEVLRVGGSGNNNRTVCAEGIAGTSTRRLEILVDQILPTVKISSWQEVFLFTACIY